MSVLSGGFSEVGVLEDGFGGRKALKRVRDDILDRFGPPVSEAFFEECRRVVHDLAGAPCTAAALHAFRQYGELGSVLFMEYVDGPSLAKLLKHSKQSLSQSVRVCGQIAQALAHAHARDIRHRDLKPNNILLNRNNEIRVIDWGLVQAKDEAQLTLGVEDYFSPQRSKDPALDDPADDIYALGALFYQCLTGGSPTKPVNPGKLEQALGEAHPKAPQELVQTVLAMLSDKQDHRPTAAETAATILQTLNDVQAREIDQGFCPGCGFIGTGRNGCCPVCDTSMVHRVARPPRDGMVRVAAGSFTHGLTEEQGRAALIAAGMPPTPDQIGQLIGGKTAPYQVFCPAFDIDVTPVTNDQYAEFVAATNYPVPEGFLAARSAMPDHPVTNVSWKDAANIQRLC